MISIRLIIPIAAINIAFPRASHSRPRVYPRHHPFRGAPGCHCFITAVTSASHHLAPKPGVVSWCHGAASCASSRAGAMHHCLRDGTFAGAFARTIEPTWHRGTATSPVRSRLSQRLAFHIFLLPFPLPLVSPADFLLFLVLSFLFFLFPFLFFFSLSFLSSLSASSVYSFSSFFSSSFASLSSSSSFSSLSLSICFSPSSSSCSSFATGTFVIDFDLLSNCF